MKCGYEWWRGKDISWYLTCISKKYHFFLKGETKTAGGCWGKALKFCFFWKRVWGERVTWELIPPTGL